jgi:hypothetical protein
MFRNDGCFSASFWKSKFCICKLENMNDLSAKKKFIHVFHSMKDSREFQNTEHDNQQRS